jgi:hypothetical protein
MFRVFLAHLQEFAALVAVGLTNEFEFLWRGVWWLVQSSRSLQGTVRWLVQSSRSLHGTVRWLVQSSRSLHGTVWEVPSQTARTQIQFILSCLLSFHSLVRLIIHSFIHPFIRPFMQSLINSFIPSLIDWFIHPFIHNRKKHASLSCYSKVLLISVNPSVQVCLDA